ncbi:MAG TPA: UDP-N-acetylmuramate:L-alanyl-gamma-D-glutamyl-meso-diaminopimelate ligase [Chthoniobacterales bacterium]|jgi:UDP-N-acetylmuramate: L-alanyl-gamma-D-glutamyl-meso-diaminopimelate ligase|nr:UDP-N-acetylmuramate:L-alanyl-gamma-D-glutamyl-meso-diaminopimelate ligase [Chthoniobacterales bacterium]
MAADWKKFIKGVFFMLKPVRRIHFMGVCGTAMGAVAAAIRDLGFVISGSDENVYPPMSTFLAKKQIPIFAGYRPENVPDDVDLVVIGNAIFRGNPELESVLKRKLLYRSLPETIKDFFLQGKHNVVVTGTHGKTTTTALVTWMFSEAGLNPGFLIGGIAKDLQQGASFPDSQYFILEGDEYDTAFFDKRSKFLHYLPETLVINNIEFDHADIFHDLEEIKTSFRRLVNIVPQSGRFFINADDPNCWEVTQKAFAPVMTVGLSENAHCRLEEIEYHQSGSRFRIGKDLFETSLIGEFNVRNAGMAAAVALSHGINLATIQKALRTFQGVARRQEIRGEVNGIKVIDDFGHHPTAIKETLNALRCRFPAHRLWAIFEPRSNTTRRAVFQQQLPDALSIADGVILAEVARIEQVPPEDRLDPWKVVKSIQQTGKPAFYEAGINQIVERMKPLARPGDVIVVFSNGGFGGIHDKLLAALA